MNTTAILPSSVINGMMEKRERGQLQRLEAKVQTQAKTANRKPLGMAYRWSKEAIAARFAEEVERSGYSKAILAHFLDMTREGLRKNMIGRTSISAYTLAAAATCGIDVQYVITGVPSENIAEWQEKLEQAFEEAGRSYSFGRLENHD